jgi:hypothetical protein
MGVCLSIELSAGFPVHLREHLARDFGGSAIVRISQADVRIANVILHDAKATAYAGRFVV